MILTDGGPTHELTSWTVVLVNVNTLVLTKPNTSATWYQIVTGNSFKLLFEHVI